MAVQSLSPSRMQKANRFMNTMQSIKEFANDESYWMTKDAGERLENLETRLSSMEKTMRELCDNVQAILIKEAKEDGAKEAKSTLIDFIIKNSINIVKTFLIWFFGCLIVIIQLLGGHAPEWLSKLIK